jgi:hypothetical protein
MAVTANKPAPYATAGSILDLIKRNRDRGLPSPLDAEALARVGVAQTLIPRTVQALHGLDLVDPKTGAPTPTFEALRLAPEAEFKKRLEDWLKGTYADIFAIVDPLKDSEEQIRDAFRGYQPVGQQFRMVLLFLGLCKAAGLMPDKTAAARPPSSSRPAAGLTPRSKTIAKRLVAEKFKDVPRHPSGIPAPLTGLLASLPAEGDSWTKAQRLTFITAFGAVLDVCFPVEPEKNGGPGDQ